MKQVWAAGGASAMVRPARMEPRSTAAVPRVCSAVRCANVSPGYMALRTAILMPDQLLLAHHLLPPVVGTGALPLY